MNKKIDFKNMKHINIRGTVQPFFGRKLILPEYNIIIVDTILGEGVSIWSNVNIYGAEIGENTRIGSFVEIGKNVKIGKCCKIEAMVFIPEGVTIGNCVFLGPNVVFTNDKYPKAYGAGDWDISPTIIKDNASIGAGSRIMCGITIGKLAIIGMGSVVVDDVPDNAVVYGERAKIHNMDE